MMRFNLLARPAFPCLVAMFGGVWGTNGNGGWGSGRQEELLTADASSEGMLTLPQGAILGCYTRMQS
jgi:hypothetical protein